MPSSGNPKSERIKARLKAVAKGRIEARGEDGALLGTFDTTSNRTLDANGNEVGKGNQLEVVMARAKGG